MFRSRRIFFSSLAGLVLCLSTAAIAKADPLVLTLQNPNQFGLPGQTIVFSASVTNTGTTNSNAAKITGIHFDGNVFDDFSHLPFIINFAQQVVAAGDTLGPLPIFTVTIPVEATLGSVLVGQVTLLYDDPISTNTESFSITVGPAPVPEPATMILLATGLAGALGSRRVRRKFRKASDTRLFKDGITTN